MLLRLKRLQRAVELIHLFSRLTWNYTGRAGAFVAGSTYVGSKTSLISPNYAGLLFPFAIWRCSLPCNQQISGVKTGVNNARIHCIVAKLTLELTNHFIMYVPCALIPWIPQQIMATKRNRWIWVPWGSITDSTSSLILLLPRLDYACVLYEFSI